MGAMPSVLRRELAGYFSTPLAYVFIVVFLLLCGFFTFEIGGFFESNQADMRALFGFLPWLYLFLVPALAMRLWAEERRSGTIELLMTLPVSAWEAVIGKYLAAWIFTSIALLFTVPLWVTVNVLGDPDNGAIVTGYLGAVLMAGGFLAIGSTVSALTKNQVIAFVLTVVACFLFMMLGLPRVLGVLSDVAPAWVVNTVSGFSFLTQFSDLQKGVVDLRAVVFFVTLIVCLLIANVIIIDTKKAD